MIKNILIKATLGKRVILAYTSRKITVSHGRESMTAARAGIMAVVEGWLVTLYPSSRSRACKAVGTAHKPLRSTPVNHFSSKVPPLKASRAFLNSATCWESTVQSMGTRNRLSRFKSDVWVSNRQGGELQWSGSA